MYEVTSNDVGVRLDHYLTNSTDLNMTRSHLKGLIKKGKVRINGLVVLRPSMHLKEGMQIEISFPPLTSLDVIAQSIPLDIRYEDQYLLIVNKPVGMVVHPAAGHPDGTLVNALLYHCERLSTIGGLERAGIVHRLDRYTSGLLVVAKDDQTHQGLASLFKTKPKDKLDRRYIAIAKGGFKEDKGTIITPYGRHPTKRLRFSSRVDSDKQAITHFWVKERFQYVTLLELRLETGRTHQIRVHMADRQRPLLGDAVYGGKTPSSWPNHLKFFPRQALHAFRLSFEHPITHEMIICEQEPPSDMTDLLRQLNSL